MRFTSEFSKETLICLELQVKDYKNLLKSSYGENSDKLMFAEVLYDIFSNVTSKPRSFFKTFNLLDTFCLLIDIRISSHGDISKLILHVNQKKSNLQFKLDYARDEILEVNKTLRCSTTQDSIEIFLDCPSVDRMLQPHNDKCAPYITGISFSKEGVPAFVEIISNKEAEDLIERLSPKTALSILELTEQIETKITSINFLARYKIPNQHMGINVSVDYLLWFTKLIFNESLDTLFSNIFYLSYYGHMSPNYVESSAVGEYTFFVSRLASILNEKSNTSSNELPTSSEHNFDDPRFNMQ